MNFLIKLGLVSLGVKILMTLFGGGVQCEKRLVPIPGTSPVETRVEEVCEHPNGGIQIF